MRFASTTLAIAFTAALVAALAGVHAASAQTARPAGEGTSEARRLVMAGDLANVEGRDALAEKLYTDALAADRSDWLPAYALAEFYFDKRFNCDEATPLFEIVIERAPEIPEVLHGALTSLQRCYERDQRWADAARLADRLIALERQRHDHRAANAALRQKASWLLYGGDLEAAEQALTQVLLNDWNDEAAHLLRAHTRRSLGRHEDALKDYLYIRQTFRPAFINLYIGVTLSHLKRWPQALEALEASLREDGELPDIHYRMATCFTEMKNPRRAEWSYRRALELASPDEPLTLTLQNNLAWLLVTHARPGDPRLLEALQLASATVRASSGREAAYTDTLAEIYLRLGQGPQAMEWAETSLRLEPHNTYFQRQRDRIRAAFFGSDQRGRIRLQRWEP